MDGASLKIMSAALPLVKQKIPPSQISWLRNGRPLEFKVEQNFLENLYCSDQKKVLQKICMCNREHIVEEEDKIFVLNDLQGWQN